MEVIRIRPLNTVSDEYREFDENYVIGDDGYIYRRLKANWYRKPEYGYQQVRSRFGTDKAHTVRISRAVALAFIDNPEGLSDVDHINNDKTDNRAVNLQWLSHKDNIKKMATDRRKRKVCG